jgi:hypothetical protein
MTDATYIPEPFGPAYNVESASLKKFRRNGGDRKAHGQAVLDAVLTAQRGQLRTAGETIPRPNCASGTLHSEGRDILKAIASQQRAKLAACAAQERKARTPAEWRKLYFEAMAEKRLNMSRAEMLAA